MMTRGHKEGKKRDDLQRLITEKVNLASADFDCKSSLEIARIINLEDAKVAGAVASALPQIARVIDWITDALAKGGRLIYVGTGTSGRIAALDAAECPPTFNTNPKMAQFVMAGGSRALAEATEASERTPFTIAAIEYARSQGAKTVAVTCNRNSALERVAHIAIVAEVGPEVVAGSTRMKAGTAQKMILNTLTTGTMTRLGYVYGNLMVNLHLKNEKLAERGIGILEKAAELSREEARRLLKAAHHSVPVALVMAKAGVRRADAAKALKRSRGHVRNAIRLAEQFR